MNKDPAILFYTSDFLTGTMLMSDEDVGVYMRLLCVQHQHGGLIDKLSFHAKTDDRPQVAAKFVETEDGFYNERMMEEMHKRSKKSKSLSANARIRWAKEKEMDSNCNANAPAAHMPTEDEDESEVEDSTSEAVEAVVIHLNEVTGCSYRHKAEATAKPIRGRLAEGFTVDDLKAVVDDRHRRWGSDEKMSEYLRPVTLFQKSKFEGYLQAAKRDAAKSVVLTEERAEELRDSDFAIPYEEES